MVWILLGLLLIIFLVAADGVIKLRRLEFYYEIVNDALNEVRSERDNLQAELEELRNAYDRKFRQVYHAVRVNGVNRAESARRN